MRFGVVIPAANEAATIEPFLYEVEAALGRLEPPSISRRIYVVCDHASVDGTAGLVAHYALTSPTVSHVWAPENRCLRDAYTRGLAAAVDDDCDFAVEMDAGYSHHPSDLHRFWTYLLAGADWVVGYRRTRWALHRWLVSRFGGWLARVLLGLPMLDPTSGYRGFSRRACKTLLSAELQARGKFYQTETNFRCWRQYGPPVEVPIMYRESGVLKFRELVEALSVLLSLRRELYEVKL